MGSNARSVDLVVLGAGIAGLAAARRAAAGGRSVLVLESGEAIGGLAASHEVAGVQVDLGSHRLQGGIDADLLADLQSLLGSDLQHRIRRGRVRVGGRWLSFPLQPRELASQMPRRLAASAAKDAVLGSWRGDRQESYASLLRRGLGPTIYDAVYGPYAEKIWGVRGDELAAEQARRRLGATSAWQLAGRLSWGREAAKVNESYWYPRRGFGQIVTALSQALVDSGGEILTQAAVTSVRARPDGVRVHWEGGEVHAGQVFSTLTLRTLGRVARPAPSAQVVADAAGLSFRALTLVYVVHEGGRWTSYDAHYVPGPQTPISRISEPANYRDSLADPADRSVICAEIPCAVGDAIWTSTDSDLYQLVEQGLQRSGLPGVRMGGGQVRRIATVYPVYARGYAERLAGLTSWADRLANVTTFGRLGLFAHDNSHLELRAAYDAADCLRSSGQRELGFDHVAWLAAQHRHERISASS